MGKNRMSAGYTLIELVVTLSIFAIVAANAIPHFDKNRVQILNAQRLVIAQLRMARTNAISKSVHYQVSIAVATQLKVARMVESPAGSGTWQIDTQNVTILSMPTGTQFKSTALGTSVEFNSRGMPLNLASVKQIDAQDNFSVTKSLQVWPSGQVNEL